MDRPALEGPAKAGHHIDFGFSSCPNDTFAFHALVHGLVAGPAVAPYIDDVEALNARAELGGAEVTKVSIAAYSRIRDRYALLRAGGAAGYGVGPIVVGRSPRAVGGRVAIPGERTTAALLLRLLGQFDTVAMRFDQIEGAILRGEVDCGVLIHEGRFTYEGKGLALLADLGAVWEERMQSPLPLAAIAIRRDLVAQQRRDLVAQQRRDLVSPVGAAIDAALRASVEYAFAHPEASRSYVAQHAQEMAPDVVQRHIQLYVNRYTVELDERAVHAMLDWQAQATGRPADETLPIFA